jgi:hypothetical protein
MKIIQISVDVYCADKKEEHPKYRLYVNNELMTERTFAWSIIEYCITEELYVNIPNGVHNIHVESVNQKGAKFLLKNIKVDGAHANSTFTI